ncbi:MAG: winged helix-turn-helix transcriptional regulator [Bacteroidaceae bacterium]|nr:winged helix-turn-helix transcriptional regulator [Bacteroidaceae bacterium]
MSELKLPIDETVADLADLFKLFGDSTRLRILLALNEGEINVTDMAESLNMTQSAVSHQLKTLRTGKLVNVRRDGKSMYYSLADEHVHTIIRMGMEHIIED